jgi:beta-galactosidase
VLWEVGDSFQFLLTPPKPSFPVKENRASWSKWHWHDHVAEWNWEGYENQPITVSCLFRLRKIGIVSEWKFAGTKNADAGRLSWHCGRFPYQSGELKVVGYEVIQ